MLAYAFAPFILLAFANYLKEKSFKWFLVTSGSLTLFAYLEFRIFYIVAWLIGFMILVKFFTLKEKNLKSLVTLGIIGILPMVFVGIANLYWLMPLVQGGGVGSVDFVVRRISGTSFLDFGKALLFFYPWWDSSTGFSVAHVTATPVHFWVFPLYAFAGFFLTRKRLISKYFLLVSIVGILLTKQSGAPFPSMYQWLYDNLPGFNIFREATKFYLILALGYSGLIALFTKWLSEDFDKAKEMGFLKVLVLVPLFLVLFDISIPSLSGKMGGAYKPYSLSNDYTILKDFFLEQKSSKGAIRNMWIPTDSHWSYFDTDVMNMSLYRLYYDNKYYDLEAFKEPALLQEFSQNVNTRVLTVLKVDFADELMDSMSIDYELFL